MATSWPQRPWLIELAAILVIAISLAVGCFPTSPSKFTYQVRVVAKDTDEYVPDAKVSIEVPDKAPLDDVTDVNGLARIFISSAHAEKPGVLIVQADGYKKHRQHIDLVEGTLPDVIQLETAATATLQPTPTTTPTSVSAATPTRTPAFTPVPFATNTPAPTNTTISTATNTPRPTNTPTATSEAVDTETQETDVTITIFADKDSLTVYVSADVIPLLSDLNLEYSTSMGIYERYYFKEHFDYYVDGKVRPPFCLRLEQRNSDRSPLPTECPPDKIAVVTVNQANVFWWDEQQRNTRTLLVYMGSDNDALGDFSAGSKKSSEILIPDCPIPTLTPTLTTTPANIPTSISTPTPTKVWVTPPTSASGSSEIVTIFADNNSLTVYVPDNATSSLKDFNLEYHPGTGGLGHFSFADWEEFAFYTDGRVPPPFCLRLERYAASSPSPIPIECPRDKTAIGFVSQGNVFWWNEQGRIARPLLVNMGDTVLGICDVGFSLCEICIGNCDMSD